MLATHLEAPLRSIYGTALMHAITSSLAPGLADSIVAAVFMVVCWFVRACTAVSSCAQRRLMSRRSQQPGFLNMSEFGVRLSVFDIVGERCRVSPPTRPQVVFNLCRGVAVAVLFGMFTRASLIGAVLVVVGSVIFTIYKCAVLRWSELADKHAAVALAVVAFFVCLCELLLAVQLLQARARRGKAGVQADDERTPLLDAATTKPADQPAKMVPFTRLFRFASPLDYLMIFVGSVCAADRACRSQRHCRLPPSRTASLSRSS